MLWKCSENALKMLENWMLEMLDTRKLPKMVLTIPLVAMTTEADNVCKSDQSASKSLKRLETARIWNYKMYLNVNLNTIFDFLLQLFRKFALRPASSRDAREMTVWWSVTPSECPSLKYSSSSVSTFRKSHQKII